MDDKTMTQRQSDERSAIPLGPRLVKSGASDRLRRAGFVLGDWQVEPIMNRIVSNGTDRSLDPLSPFVQTTRVTFLPSAHHFAIVPPAADSESSGCGVTTNIDSGSAMFPLVLDLTRGG